MKARPSSSPLILTLLLTFVTGSCLPQSSAAEGSVEIVNASYDPTRAFYQEYNKMFSRYWLAKTGQTLRIQQSHAESKSQAKAVMEGLTADVITLGMSTEIDSIAANSALLPKNWQAKLPNESAPYSSTIVFLVRKGNPHHVSEWEDLIKPGVSVVMPDPKTSDVARWSYMAAWGFAQKKFAGDEVKIKQFMTALLKQVRPFDASVKDHATSFTEQNLGDVMLTWESDAFLATKRSRKDSFEIAVPSVSIVVEPTVALVTANAERRGVTEVAEAYLKHLFTKESQKLLAENFFRPFDKQINRQYSYQFSTVTLINIDELGGWQAAQEKHFVNGGVLDQLVAVP